MNYANFPTGLPDYGYSMQAAALASALVERENAHVFQSELRDWLDRIECTTGGVWGSMEGGREFAEFLTNLVRIGSGLPAIHP